MSVSLGPIRFNGDVQADHFCSWVQSEYSVDVDSVEDWEVQKYYDEYSAACAAESET